ncbi:MAG: nucleotide exchange factor GrpE [Candidatus Bipolaricaulota bacterium]|nr:nucleotide exchange factor GrpE [Candidatus Bipolaricaulota bacterium]
MMSEETRPNCEGVPVEGPPAGDTCPASVVSAKDDEIRSLVDRLQRLQAEFENYRKRILRDVAAVEERVSDREILVFLPLYDNLERAFSVYAKDANVEAFVAGVERIFGQFAQILDQKGVRRIPTMGERFDPELHEALLSIHSQQEKHTIIEEFSPGYVRGERTLQPSKVSVSQGPAPAEKEEP